MDSVLAVSQLNRYVKSVLDSDFRLKDLMLRGEISNFVNHYRSGHFYFTLKEGGCAVKAVMFANYANALPFEPENGMAVIVRCSVSLYERDGSYQIYVYEMQPDGKGALQLAFEQLYRRLEAQGLFSQENKIPLPRYAMRIGVVTSSTGAALQDIVNVLSRRCPMATLVLSPAPVQGADAPVGLIKALDALDRRGNCDVIIIGRGGGSMEDLWCFNDEQLVRRVAACKTPVVSAVGHEIDYTLCDYAADLRAPTPSAAAELVSEDGAALLDNLESLCSRIEMSMQQRLEKADQRLQNLLDKPVMRRPQLVVEQARSNLESYAVLLERLMREKLQQNQRELQLQTARLQALNPLARLAGGYSVTTHDGSVVSSVGQLTAGDLVDIRLSDGVVHAQVTSVSSLKGVKKNGRKIDI